MENKALSHATAAVRACGGRILLCMVLLTALAGCAPRTSSTGNVPLPPAAQLMVADKTLADAANTAVKGLIAARNAGKISAADTATGEKYCAAIAKLTDDIANELVTNEAGATLRTKLLQIVATDSLPSIASVSQGAAVITQQVVTLVTALLQQIGGVQ